MLRLLIVMLCASAAASAAPSTQPTTRRAKVLIALAGDSTVTDKVGWGVGFAKQLTGDVECINFSQGGRSSKSFIDEGHWKKVLDAKPDYILIQFGHNDQPGKGPERETDPKTTYRANLIRYIDEARAIGAKPVLVTSIVRRNFDENGKIKRDPLVGYAQAVRSVAAEKHVG